MCVEHDALMGAGEDKYSLRSWSIDTLSTQTILLHATDLNTCIYINYFPHTTAHL